MRGADGYSCAVSGRWMRRAHGGLPTVDVAWRGVAGARDGAGRGVFRWCRRRGRGHHGRVLIWARHRNLVDCNALAATSVGGPSRTKIRIRDGGWDGETNGQRGAAEGLSLAQKTALPKASALSNCRWLLADGANGKGQLPVGRLGKPLRARAIRGSACLAWHRKLHCCSGQNDMGSDWKGGGSLMQVPEMQSTARGSRASSAMQRPIHCSRDPFTAASCSHRTLTSKRCGKCPRATSNLGLSCPFAIPSSAFLNFICSTGVIVSHTQPGLREDSMEKKTDLEGPEV